MNSVPLRYRLLLLGLLPIVAVVLYVTGQSYDPALIDFKSVVKEEATGAAAQPESALAVLAPSTPVKDLAGYSQLGRARTYTKDNLYEHVDGHAEYFISAGFAGLVVYDFIATGSKAAEPDLQAEVFDMGKTIQAFGVLVDESGEKPESVSVGDMGFKTSGGVNFIRGRYYVKISAPNPKASSLKFALAFAETLPAGKDSFQGFAKLPRIGKIQATRFIKEGYLGLDFLHNVVEREYLSGDKKIKVALMSGSAQEMQALKTAFFDYFRKSKISYEKLGSTAFEAYRVVDKYEGNWFFIPAKDSIFAVFGTNDEAVLDTMFKGKG
jgi:hypothetical protein